MIDNYNKAIIEYNKGVKYLHQQRFEKARPYFKSALKQWEFKEAYLNLANCYKAENRDSDAREAYLKANSKDIPCSSGQFLPLYDLALNNLGLLAYKHEQDETAVQLFQKVLDLNPKNYNSLFNLSITRLRQYCSHKYDRPDLAWQLYSARFKMDNKPTTLKGSKKLIAWMGVHEVDSIVVMAEQGVGDYFMFARYLRQLEIFAKKIWIQCDNSSKSLFDTLGYPTCWDTIETDATHGVAIGDLPSLFSSEIPPSQLFPSVKLGDGIGCVWSGSKTHANDRNRSTVPGYFRSLAKFGKLYTINPTEHGTPGFQSLNNSNWLETYNEISKLRLVVTVDTSIANFCGAIGFPCWVLMPLADSDFRWGDSSMGESNVWYPSVRVFRNRNEWEPVFDKVRSELEKC